MVNIPTLDEMLKAGMHFGHRTSRWHPKMKPFIFTSRNNIHIIDLRKTQKMLVTAMDFMKKMVAEDKTILFVGTKTQAKKPLKRLAAEAGMPYVVEKWLGGTLTNFAIIRKVIKKYVDLTTEKAAGRLSKYTKKEQLEFDREIGRLETKVGGLVSLKKLPDALFIWDIKQEKNAVAEAKKRNVPVIAVCDTNTDPTGIKYVIPSNDDATKTIKLVVNLIKETIDEGRNEAAKRISDNSRNLGDKNLEKSIK